jgi:hypothetical protein
LAHRWKRSEKVPHGGLCTRSAPALDNPAARGRAIALQLLDQLEADTALDLPTKIGLFKDIAGAMRTFGGTMPAAGKKEAAADAAERAASGRFATPAVPPKLVIGDA